MIYSNGDSNTTLKNFNGEKMDILHIDGSHDYNIANTDFMLCRKIGKNSAIVIWDDVWINSLSMLWNDYVDKKLVYQFSLLPTPMYSHAFGYLVNEKLKIALVSITIGENYKRVTKYGRVSKTQYCEKNGYDFFDDDSVCDSLRPPAWAKVKQILLHLSRYDYIMWIDADTYIMNQNRLVENLIYEEMNGRDILIARDCDIMNSGVMVIRNTRWSKKFFELVYDQVQFLHHSNWEQAAIIDLYEKNISNAHEHFTVLPVYKQNKMNSYWYTYDFHDCYILHFPGCWRNNTDLSLSIVMYKYCPIRRDEDDDASYANRLRWLEFDSREDARQKLLAWNGN